MPSVLVAKEKVRYQKNLASGMSPKDASKEYESSLALISEYTEEIKLRPGKQSDTIFQFACEQIKK